MFQGMIDYDGGGGDNNRSNRLGGGQLVWLTKDLNFLSRRGSPHPLLLVIIVVIVRTTRRSTVLIIVVVIRCTTTTLIVIGGIHSLLTRVREGWVLFLKQKKNRLNKAVSNFFLLTTTTTNFYCFAFRSGRDGPFILLEGDRAQLNDPTRFRKSS